jgi:hypothetical protein
LRKRRTRAFNEVDDNIDFNEFANNDEVGEIGENGQVIKEDSEPELDEEEDQVGDLDFEDSNKDLFEIGSRRQRHTSAMVSSSELFKGLDEIKKKGDDLDERLKMIVGEDNLQEGGRTRK